MPVVNPGIRRQVAGAITRLFNSASFDAPLTRSLVPERGTGSPTFTRATTATFTDYEGVMRTAPAGCARFEGARMVRNLLSAANADLTTGWTKTNCTVTTGVVDPEGGTTAITITATSANAAWFVAATDASPTTSSSYLPSFYIKRRTGTGSVKILNPNGGTGSAITVTTSWTRISGAVGGGAGGTNAYLGIAEIATSGDAIDVWHPQLENVTGQSDQTASEYVSVGVESAPYHGAGVDGVEFFNTDRSGNPIPAATNLGYFSEGARTNLLLNSATVATQNITTAATPYTLSFKGTGTITLSETSTAGPLVGTGANDRVSLTFTPTAGTLTLTVSGTCTEGQAEAGSFMSSYIATAGTAATRNADVKSDQTASNIAAAASSVYLEFTPTHTPSGTIALWGTYVDASNYTAILHDATNLIMRKRIAGVNTDATIANNFVAGTTYKVLGSWGAAGQNIYLNGTKGTAHANTTAAQIGASMQFGADGNSLQQPFAAMRNERVWQRQLSDAEGQAVTS